MKIKKKLGSKAVNLRNLEVPMPLALLPLWSDFSEPVDYMNWLLQFGLIGTVHSQQCHLSTAI